jgi:hypothetical protein
LTRAAATPTLEDVLDRVARLQGGHFSFAEAVEALHQARDER